MTGTLLTLQHPNTSALIFPARARINPAVGASSRPFPGRMNAGVCQVEREVR
jgi:hypothetical protein